MRPKLTPSEKEEIINHLDLTKDKMVKAYTLTQLACLEWKSVQWIKLSGKYIPIRIDEKYNKYMYNRGQWKKPYAIRYIRVDEIKYIYKKRNKKTELVEQYK